MLPRYTECSFSAFISYAHADDAAHLHWVKQFAQALETTLRGRLKMGVEFKKVHLSQLNGPIAGSLSSELQNRITESFSMIIVVGNKYLDSKWCLKELEFFCQRLQSNGLKGRLYVLALSETAMMEIKARKDWSQLVLPDQVWIPFYKSQDSDEPVNILLAHEEYTSEFSLLLRKIVRDLSSKINRDLESKTEPPATREIDPTCPTAKKAELRVVIGVVTADLMDAKNALTQALAAQGEMAVTQVAYDSVIQYDMEGDLASELENTHVLVLPFSGAAPLVPVAGTGGHLSLQKREWERLGGERELLWYRPSVVTGAVKKAASGAHAEFITSLQAAAVTQDQLIGQLCQILAKTQQGNGDPPTRQLLLPKVIIYIESNPIERFEWQSLSLRIGEIWNELIAGTPYEHQIEMRTRGLNLDELDPSKHGNLYYIDGVILLWGQKAADSLRSQINLVENFIPFEQPLVPGFIAYLIPPHEDEGPKPAHEWNVFRFRKLNGRIEEVAEETAQIRAFLEGILIHRTQSSELPKH